MDRHVPGFPDINLMVWTGGAGVYVQYCGNVSDILAAGITTAAVLAKRPPKGPRPPRRDADGGKIWINFWNIVRDGVVVPRVKVTFPGKPLHTCRKLPGFNAAWDLAQQEAAKRAERDKRRAEVEPSKPQLRRLPNPNAPALRLVVDNTR